METKEAKLSIEELTTLGFKIKSAIHIYEAYSRYRYPLIMAEHYLATVPMNHWCLTIEEVKQSCQNCGFSDTFIEEFILWLRNSWQWGSLLELLNRKLYLTLFPLETSDYPTSFDGVEGQWSILSDGDKKKTV